MHVICASQSVERRPVEVALVLMVSVELICVFFCLASRDHLKGISVPGTQSAASLRKIIVSLSTTSQLFQIALFGVDESKTVSQSPLEIQEKKRPEACLGQPPGYCHVIARHVVSYRPRQKETGEDWTSQDRRALVRTYDATTTTEGLGPIRWYQVTCTLHLLDIKHSLRPLRSTICHWSPSSR